ncbi:MAG TPA: hypothetical protein VGO96_14045 [Pyrinomonadaceae bacterium]|nr:hypothetical protein [Pyrinomonadaceae bacterium]
MPDPASHRLKYLLPLACLLLLAHTTQAQTATTTAAPAVKWDEFGDIAASDLIARLDNFAVQLQNDPNTRGFLVVYRTRRDLPGLSNRYAHAMKDYLVKTRGLPAERIVTVDGGVILCLTQEIWLVPIGATPAIRTDAYWNAFPDAAYKFDEHYYEQRTDSVGETVSYWSFPPHNLQGYLEAYAAALRKEPRASGYLVAYMSLNQDRPTLAQKMLQTERNFLIKHFNIKPSRIKTINGGYRRWRGMELWIVPPGEPPPLSPPGSVSKRRRRR